MAAAGDNVVNTLMNMTRFYDEMFDLNEIRANALMIQEELAKESDIAINMPDDDKGFVIEYLIMNYCLFMSTGEGKLSRKAVEIAAMENLGQSNIYPFYLWHTDKVTYRFDQDVEEMFLQQAKSFNKENELPVQILKYLPHKIFFVKTNISPLKGNSEYGRLTKGLTQLGFLFHYGDVYMIKDGVMSKDPERNSIEIYILFERKESQEISALPALVFFSKNDTIKSVVENTVANFCFNGNADQFGAEYDSECSTHITIFQWAMQYVFYLCSVNAEVEQDPVNRQIYRHPTPGFVKNRPREVLLMDAGKKTGAMIHAFKQKRCGSRSVGSGTATAKSPHVRRAHWHHYWTGRLSHPEERHLVIKWVAPSYIHREMYELTRPSVGIVKDQKPRRDGCTTIPASECPTR